MDAQVDFNLDLSNANLTEMAGDHMGVRWTGFLKAPLSENFTFTTQVIGNDVVRLFIANQLVVYQDNSHGNIPQGQYALLASG